jgi:hypothetical protein
MTRKIWLHNYWTDFQVGGLHLRSSKNFEFEGHIGLRKPLFYVKFKIKTIDISAKQKQKQKQKLNV